MSFGRCWSNVFGVLYAKFALTKPVVGGARSNIRHYISLRFGYFVFVFGLAAPGRKSIKFLGRAYRFPDTELSSEFDMFESFLWSSYIICSDRDGVFLGFSQSEI